MRGKGSEIIGLGQVRFYRPVTIPFSCVVGFREAIHISGKICMVLLTQKTADLCYMPLMEVTWILFLWKE